jgi:hypothetical protein
MRIGHFGFLANPSKKQALAQCRILLKLDRALPQIPKQSALVSLRELIGVNLNRLPNATLSLTKRHTVRNSATFKSP